MRPVARRQSALRYPLNEILGTEASVRIVRTVFLSEIPIGVSELARQAELQPSGVARVCNALEDLGVIEAVGRGSRNRQYRRASRVAFTEQLRALFDAERERWNRLWNDLQVAVRTGASRSAWIEGPAAEGRDRPGDTVAVVVLTDTERVEDVRQGIWQNLLHLQARFDFSADLRVITMPDLQTLDKPARATLQNVRLLYGPPPAALLDPKLAAAGQTSRRHHSDLDQRSARFARTIAERIRRDPAMIEDAVLYLERQLPMASAGERLELEEWRSILTTMSPSRIRRLLTESSPRADRLRQSSPFLAIISDEDRRRFKGQTGTT